MNSQLTWLAILSLCFAGCSAETGPEPAVTSSTDLNAGQHSGRDSAPGADAGAERAGPGGGRGFGGGGFDPAAIFKQRDADGDGKLSGDEMSDRMREGLAEIDTDGDGAVTLEEFQARMQRFRGGGGRPGGGQGGGRFDPAAIFERSDTDGDGKLSGDEIPDRMREGLAEIDTDGDGAVTLEEFQARMEQFRGRGPGGGGPGRDDGGNERPERPQRPAAE